MTPLWLARVFADVDASMEEVRESERLRERMTRQPAPASPAKQRRTMADEFAAALAKQFAAAGIKTIEYSTQPLRQPARQESTMSPEQRWNEDQHILTLINRKWEQELSGYITKAINKAVDQLFNATAEAISLERGNVDKKLAALRKELLDEMILRADAEKFDRAARGGRRPAKTAERQRVNGA
jgi:hypothetical protein